MLASKRYIDMTIGSKTWVLNGPGFYGSCEGSKQINKTHGN